MSQEPAQQYQQTLGVTPPISTAMPTPNELKLTEDLLQTLKDYGLFESEQEAQKRYASKTIVFGLRRNNLLNVLICI